MTKTSSHDNHWQWHPTSPDQTKHLVHSKTASVQQPVGMKLGRIIDKCLFYGHKVFKRLTQTYHLVYVNQFYVAKVIFLFWFQNFFGKLHKLIKSKLINYLVDNVTTMHVALVSPPKTSYFYLTKGTRLTQQRKVYTLRRRTFGASRGDFSHIPK